MRVNVPNLGLVDFPDTMSPEEVKSHIETRIIPQIGKFLGQQAGPHPAFQVPNTPQVNAPAGPIPSPSPDLSSMQFPVGNSLPGTTPNASHMPPVGLSGLLEPPSMVDQMDPGGLRAVAQQMTLPNIGLGAVLPAAYAAREAIPALKPILSTIGGLFATQGAAGAGTAAGQLSAGNQTEQEKTESQVNLILNSLMMAGTPKIGEPVAGALAEPLKHLIPGYSESQLLPRGFFDQRNPRNIGPGFVYQPPSPPSPSDNSPSVPATPTSPEQEKGGGSLPIQEVQNADKTAIPIAQPTPPQPTVAEAEPTKPLTVNDVAAKNMASGLVVRDRAPGSAPDAAHAVNNALMTLRLGETKKVLTPEESQQFLQAINKFIDEHTDQQTTMVKVQALQQTLSAEVNKRINEQPKTTTQTIGQPPEEQPVIPNEQKGEDDETQTPKIQTGSPVPGGSAPSEEVPGGKSAVPKVTGAGDLQGKRALKKGKKGTKGKTMDEVFAGTNPAAPVGATVPVPVSKAAAPKEAALRIERPDGTITVLSGTDEEMERAAAVFSGKKDMDVIKGTVDAKGKFTKAKIPRDRRGESGSIAFGSPNYGASRRAQEARFGEENTPEPGEWPSLGESLQRGRELLAQGADPRKAVKLFIKDPQKKLDHDTIALVWAHGRELALASNKALDEHGLDSAQYAAADKAEKEWMKETQPVKTTAGQLLAALRGEVDLDTDTFSGMVRAFEKKPTKEQETHLREVAKQNQEAKAAEELKWSELQQRLDTLQKAYEAEQAKPKAANKTGAELLADAAKYGFSGSQKALLGLSKLFGGGSGHLGSGPVFNEKTWAEARPMFQEAWEDFKKSGKSLSAFADWTLGQWGENVQPYVERFVKEQGAAEQPIEQPVKQPTKPIVRRTRKLVDTMDEKKPKTVRKKKAAPIEADDLKKLLSSTPPAQWGARESTAVWTYIKQKYVDLSKTTFAQVIRKVADDTGLTYRQVAGLMTRDGETSRISNELYKAQSERAKIKMSTYVWLKRANKEGWEKAFEDLPKIRFLMETAIHSTVWPGTHAPVLAFDKAATWKNPTSKEWEGFYPALWKAFKAVYKTGYHQDLVNEIVTHPMFYRAKRAGVMCDPYEYGDDYQRLLVTNPSKYPWMGKVMDHVTGSAGFDALKYLRLQLFTRMLGEMHDKLKLDPNGEPNYKFEKLLAKDVNHPTGAIATKLPKVLNTLGDWVLFAKSLEASRWAYMIADPARAASTIIKWNRSTPEAQFEAKAVIRQRARVIGAYIALLAANQGYLSFTGSNQKVNGVPGGTFNPGKGDFMAFKFGNHAVGPMSAILGPERLIFHMLATAYNGMTGEENRLHKVLRPQEEDAERLGDYGRGKLSPISQDFADFATSETASHMVVPWSQLKPKQGERKLGYWEYGFGTKLPIPIEAAIRETWEMQGMPSQQVGMWLNALLVGGAEGSVGLRVTPDMMLKTQPGPPEKRPPGVPDLDKSLDIEEKLQKKMKKLNLGSILQRNGKNYQVTEFDKDGEPMVEDVSA